MKKNCKVLQGYKIDLTQAVKPTFNPHFIHRTEYANAFLKN